MVERNSGVTVKEKNSKNSSPMIFTKSSLRGDSISEHDAHGASVQAKVSRNKEYINDVKLWPWKHADIGDMEGMDLKKR